MDDTNTGTEETLDTQDDTTESTVEEPQEEVDYKSLYEKEKEIAENQKKRAEKAEAKAKESREVVRPSNELSAVDILAVSKAGIEPEDLSEVLEYAKFKGIPVHEALKSSVVKATLAERQELRKSAEATNTGTARRGSSQVSDERLIENARKGVMPESDEDLKRLVGLRKRG